MSAHHRHTISTPLAYCVTQAGLVSSNSWVTDTNAAIAWNAMKSGVSQTPTVGSLFYTKNVNSTDVASHTGIVVSVASSTSFEVVEGDYNGSISVTKRTYATSTGYTLLGFVKPVGM
ncbi:MAG: CHAP domain-containing protein [Candidatus Limiplasma sp.]|nr:CHAP domain-containing protein [Candidatus Limiplasma sp.]